MTFTIVHTHTNHGCTHFFQLLKIIAKDTSLLGAARRVILGIKIQHQPLSAKILQRMLLTTLIQQLKFGAGSPTTGKSPERAAHATYSAATTMTLPQGQSTSFSLLFITARH
jgi:hypothetical protein